MTGAGCAGLSLAVHMIHSGKFSDKKILIIDKEKKNKNDRTWCFWEKQNDLFESIVFKKWKHLWFHTEKRSRLLDLFPYEYKMIRGIDFYNYCFSLIKQQKNFHLNFGNIEGLQSDERTTSVIVNGQKISAKYIFNSILFEKIKLKKKEYFLQQHFKGWIIETKQTVFNQHEPVLMDFRIEQQFGTAFVYVMPFSETKALIEYTLFSNDLLKPEQYSIGLKKYIENFLNISSYTIIEEEFGVIPMTNHKFPSHSGNIVNIGTVGGQTKPSSGYTFRFIQKHSAALVQRLEKTGNPFLSQSKEEKKFHFYDSTLLNILHHKKLSGKKIFTELFLKNKPLQVLRFLDNESSLAEEVKIIFSLPVFPFLKAAWQQV
ncbi:MAG TPA: lycopene cyclase family protein [Chitinophagaceae bacterium]|nr:lycopene cyclase family protein [Chitinophagaceae bacterium]